jgi:sugar O-acyltransferase (sialic acid O-acetyltransferase NeuD family)
MTDNVRSELSNGVVLGLYGAGGFAREVMPLALEYLSIPAHLGSESVHKVYFVESSPQESEVDGLPLISESEFIKLECSKRLFNVAIGDSRVRERIANECIERGARPLSLQSRNSIIYDNNVVGEGAILCAFTMITSNARIGRFFHSNIYSYVAHDCVIGDFVTFAPNVHCNGNVHIHSHAYIGTGAVIKQGTAHKPLVIGEGSIVGMGAVVTRDVPPYTTVVGNPAKPHQTG